eukprot:COSAG01_NODE_11148_length_1995_cov_18.404850_1_plen_628_part_01
MMPMPRGTTTTTLDADDGHAEQTTGTRQASVTAVAWGDTAADDLGSPWVAHQPGATTAAAAAAAGAAAAAAAGDRLFSSSDEGSEGWWGVGGDVAGEAPPVLLQWPSAFSATVGSGMLGWHSSGSESPQNEDDDESTVFDSTVEPSSLCAGVLGAGEHPPHTAPPLSILGGGVETASSASLPATAKRRCRHNTSAELAYNKMWQNELPARPAYFYPGLYRERTWFRERTETSTGRPARRKKHSDRWDSKGPGAQTRCEIGRFRELAAAPAAPAITHGSVCRFDRCTGSGNQGIGRIIMTRQPFRLVCRDQDGKPLPQMQQGLFADEWTLTYVFDDERPPHVHPTQVFEVQCRVTSAVDVPGSWAAVSGPAAAEQSLRTAAHAEFDKPVHIDLSEADLPSQPLLTLSARAGQPQRFVQFTEAGRDIGAIEFSDFGLSLQTSSGDFAEWHAALRPEDLPFTEGAVVGFFGEKVSLQTDGAIMFGIISKRAAVVGSVSSSKSKAEGGCVAYAGKVPVRAFGPVCAGQALVPSGRQDGCARAVPPESPQAALKVGIAHTSLPSGSVGPVMVSVTAPGLGASRETGHGHSIHDSLLTAASDSVGSFSDMRRGSSNKVRDSCCFRRKFACVVLL